MTENAILAIGGVFLLLFFLDSGPVDKAIVKSGMAGGKADKGIAGLLGFGMILFCCWLLVYQTNITKLDEHLEGQDLCLLKCEHEQGEVLDMNLLRFCTDECIYKMDEKDVERLRQLPHYPNLKFPEDNLFVEYEKKLLNLKS